MSKINETALSRWLNVLLAVAIGFSIVGFFVGTRPLPTPKLLDRNDKPQIVKGAIPSVPYAELRFRRFGPNAEVSSDLQRLRCEIPNLLDKVERSIEQLDDALAERAENRAYDGAPPVIPHAIDQQRCAACLACHATGIRVAGHRASVISHRIYQNCTQCHAPTFSDIGSGRIETDNRFVGLNSPVRGTRAWPGAPPTIPHPTHMRENCDGCHGVAGLNPLRTTHPARRACRQCHSASVDETPW